MIKNNKRGILVSLLAAITLQGGAAVAQSGGGLEEILVTAQRRVQNLQDVPISIDTLSSVQIDRAQVVTLRDLANLMPSLNFVDSTNTTTNNMVMRGIGQFGPQAGIQPGVVVMVDGFVLGRQVELDQDMSDIESVQVLTGPQGTLFGSNALGGVINVTTKQPTDTFEGYTEASVTTDSEFNKSAMLSGPLTERVRGRVNIFAKDRDGYQTNIYPGMPKQGYGYSQGGTSKLDIDINENINLKIRGDYRKLRTGNILKIINAENPNLVAAIGNGDPVSGRKIMEDPSLVNTKQAVGVESGSWGMAADLTWKLNDEYSLKSITNHRDLKNDSIPSFEFDATPGTLADPRGLTTMTGFITDTDIDGGRGGKFSNSHQLINDLEYFTQELRLEFSSDKIEALVGGYYNRTNELFYVGTAQVTVGYPVNLPHTLTVADIKRDADLSLRVWSLFGDVTWHLTDTFSLFGGYRWTEEVYTNDFHRNRYTYNQTQFTYTGLVIKVDPSVRPNLDVKYVAKRQTGEWTGRAGAVWKVTSNINVYGSASRGFTGVGADSGGGAVEEFAFVDPMTAESYEIGAKSTLFDNRLRLNMAIFRATVYKIQLFQFDPITGVTKFGNADSMDTEGLEATATAMIGEQFTVNGSVTLMDTALTGGTLFGCHTNQTVAEGCFDHDGNGTREQALAGKTALSAPDLKYNITGTYDLVFGSMPFNGFVTASYTWQDEIAMDLGYDPRNHFQAPYSLVDLTAGITDKNDRYEVSLFGKNIQDRSFISDVSSGNNGRSARALFTRSAHAYWGLKARVNF